MSWVMVGASAISAVGGLLGNRSAKKTQKQAIKLQREELEFSKKRYNDYQEQYGGINDLVISEAEKGVVADVGRVTSEASADTATAFQNAQTALDNQNQRMGINPNSGRAESSNRKLGLSQAMATAGNVTNARNTERKNANDQTWNRRYSVYQGGTSLINGAATNVSNSTNNMVNTLNGNANQQMLAANSAIGNAASLGIQAYTGYKANIPTTTTLPISAMDTGTKGLKVGGQDMSSGVLYDNIKLNNNGPFLG